MKETFIEKRFRQSTLESFDQAKLFFEDYQDYPMKNTGTEKMTTDQILAEAKTALKALELNLGGEYEFHIGVFVKPKTRGRTFNRVNSVSAIMCSL